MRRKRTRDCDVFKSIILNDFAAQTALGYDKWDWCE